MMLDGLVGLNDAKSHGLLARKVRKDVWANYLQLLTIWMHVAINTPPRRS